MPDPLWVLAIKSAFMPDHVNVATSCNNIADVDNSASASVSSKDGATPQSDQSCEDMESRNEGKLQPNYFTAQIVHINL